MIFSPDKHQHDKLVYIDITLAGETLTFSTKPFGRMSFTNSHIFYDNVNEYLSDFRPEDKLELFELYRGAKEIINEVRDIERIRSSLTAVVTKICDLIDYESFHKWFMMFGKFSLPNDLLSEVPDSNLLNKQLTYIHHDYVNLLSFSVYLKLITPIFGDYLEIINRDIDSKFKDQSAFSLITKSNLMESEPIERLKVYVEAYIVKEHSKAQPKINLTSAIFGGLGADELPDWLLGRAVVRKLSLYEEQFEMNNVVAAVCTHFDHLISRMDRDFGGSITNKDKTISSSSYEEKTSYAENYKIKQSISDGDLAVLSSYTENLEPLVLTVDPTTDLEILRKCEENIKSRNSFTVSEHQLRLTQWVLAPAISPRGIPILNKQSLIKAITATQALLWHWGFTELAVLMTASPYDDEGFSAPSFVRVHNKTIARLDELYPYRQSLAKNATVRETNPAMIAIKKMTAIVARCDWESLAPKELEVELNLDPKLRVLYVSSDLQVKLAELIEKINQNDEEYGH